MGRRNHYSAYIIELATDVLREGKFRKCNPGCISGRPCIYAGMTLPETCRYSPRR